MEGTGITVLLISVNVFVLGMIVGKYKELLIAQNSATHTGPFLSLVALNLKSRESKDAQQ